MLFCTLTDISLSYEFLLPILKKMRTTLLQWRAIRHTVLWEEIRTSAAKIFFHFLGKKVKKRKKVYFLSSSPFLMSPASTPARLYEPSCPILKKMVPSREPGRETGMESWVTEPRKGTYLEVFDPDFPESPEERISIDTARCFTVGKQTGAICAEKHTTS